MKKKLHKRGSALPMILWMMLITLFPAQLSARDFNYTHEGQTLKYTVIDEDAKTVEVRSDKNIRGALEIPSEVSDETNQYTVISIGDEAFLQNTYLTSVTIPNTVITIGDYAFQSCKGLTSITIPESVTTIGECTFSFCDSMLDIKLPESLTSIGIAAFYNCTKLPSIVIPDAVTTIGESAFSDCRALSNIKLPESLTSISNYMFAWCYNLTSITIPDAVTTIGESAFNICRSLTSINIPGSVTSIGKNAFYCCIGLTSLFIPSSVVTIKDYAFYECSGLTSVIISNPKISIGKQVFDECGAIHKTAYPSSIANPFSNGVAISYPAEGALYEDGFVWNEDKSILYFVPLNVGSDFSIAESVVKIGPHAFYGCDGITELNVDAVLPPAIENNSFPEYSAAVTVPSGSLAYYIDSKWNNFANLKDGSGITSDSGTFSYDIFNYRVVGENEVALVAGDYSELTTAAIPGQVVYNGKAMNVTAILGAFAECNNLRSIIFPNQLKLIGNETFIGCNALKAINLPESLISIGNYAFGGCTGLTRITANKRLERVYDNAFSNCTSLTTFSHKGIGEVGSRAFQFCYNLDNIIVDWEKIREYTFLSCTNLAAPTLTDAVKEIGDRAFAYCNGLTKMSIPASVLSIGNSAFANCTNMSSFILEDGFEMLKIEEKVLENTPIVDMYIGREYTCSRYGSISKDVQSLTFGNTVSTIPASAFSGASKLSSVNFGSSIETIASDAFSYCALTELVFPPHLKSIGMSAFVNNPIKSIAFGSELAMIGSEAFYRVNSTEEISITALTAPSTDYDSFSYFGCPLYVAPGCVDEYQNSTWYWKDFTVHELIPANKVEIDGPDSVVLKPGESIRLSATISPADASLPYVFWHSTNPAFAMVDREGYVTRIDNSEASAQSDDTPDAQGCEIIAETLYAGVVASVRVSAEDITTGIENIATDDATAEIARPNDIYNLQGACIKRNASQADVDALAPGLYIVAGKKVFVR